MQCLTSFFSVAPAKRWVVIFYAYKTKTLCSNFQSLKKCETPIPQAQLFLILGICTLHFINFEAICNVRMLTMHKTKRSTIMNEPCKLIRRF